MSRPGKPEISLKQIFFSSFSSYVFCLFIKFKIYIVIKIKKKLLHSLGLVYKSMRAW
jgi:hypothetical protein